MKTLTTETVREASNVNKANVYVFPSTQNSLCRVSGWHAVSRVSRDAELQFPDRMTATRMLL